MLRKDSFMEGETYHLYNRGAHKQRIFTNEIDYRRFLLLLHLSNNAKREPVRVANLLRRYQGYSWLDIFIKEPVEERLVDVFAYCLMPNHFHIVVRQIKKNGITLFMKKLLTAYSMYFNTKYDHSGVLFQGRFKSSLIDSESYFRYIFSYVHLNPVELYQPNWKSGKIKNVRGVRDFIKGYAHSSLLDYEKERPQASILNLKDGPGFLKTQNDIRELLRWFEQGRSLLKEEGELHIVD